MGDFNYMLGLGQRANFLDMLNDCAMDQLAMESTRGAVTLHLIVSDAQNLMHDLDVGKPIGNSDHNAIWFNIYMGRKLTRNFTTITFNFNR